MPPHIGGQAVGVLLELPAQPGLAHPGGARYQDQPRDVTVGGRVEQVLDRAQLGVPAGQRRLQAVDPLAPAHRGQDPERPPQPLRLRLALQRVLTGIGKGDRAAGQPLGRHVDQHRARPGGGLHPRRGVHRVAGHHPLTDRAQVHRHLAGHHSGPGGQAGQPRLGAQFGDRGHQVQRGPDGSLRVAFCRYRSAPHGHDRVPDELLYHPAIAADHRARHREVLRQQLADRLGVARLRQRGEPDHVAEQHRAHPPLGRRLAARLDSRRGRGGRGLEQGGTAITAETLAGSQRLAARGTPADGSAAVPAEQVAIIQWRTAPPAPHPASPALGTSTRSSPYVSAIVGTQVPAAKPHGTGLSWPGAGTMARSA